MTAPDLEAARALLRCARLRQMHLDPSKPSDCASLGFAPEKWCRNCTVLGTLSDTLAELAQARAALAECRLAVQLALNRDLAGLANDGTPERGAVVEAECPHDGGEECPWADAHEAIRTYRAALAAAALAQSRRDGQGGC